MNFSEILGTLSLVIGLQAIIMFFYTKGVDKVIADQRKAFNKANTNAKHIAFFHETLLVNLQEISATNRLYGSLLQRIANEISLNIADKIPEAIGNYDFNLEKSLHELCLFSADTTRRNSAVRALAEEYGNFDTYELMVACINDFTESPDEILKVGLKDLKMRISKFQL